MTVVWLALFVLGVALSFFSIRWALAYYLVGSLIFPVLWLGETPVRFEMVYCLWLFILVLFNKLKKDTIFRINKAMKVYALFLVIVLLATLVNISSSGQSFFELSAQFYGLARPFLVMFLFSNASLPLYTVESIIWVFMYLNIPIALLTIGQSLGLDLAQRITVLGYSSPWRTAISILLSNTGRILRSPGVFESPTYNGVYFTLVLCTASVFLLQSAPKGFKKLFLYGNIGLAFLGGISTLSSTFLLGSLVVIVLVTVTSVKTKHYRAYWVYVMGVCIVLLFTALVISEFIEDPLIYSQLEYKVRGSLSGEVFDSRYGSDSSGLVKVYRAVLEKPLLGWGLVNTEGVFIGDSLYFTVFYSGGILGSVLFFLVILRILRHSLYLLNKTYPEGVIGAVCLLWTLASLAEGLGSGAAFYVLRLEEWYWAVVAVAMSIPVPSRSSNIGKSDETLPSKVSAG
ncbi:hypothetical protein [Coprothermobacter proteolyticus]|uniref:hypothetical protein n=1 Tax=Coprothermobacter proteolyticus TaxID=35786 RepID=UPI000D31C9B3|nr:hypothetical protein [Coprothermobacter proteolyticus]